MRRQVMALVHATWWHVWVGLALRVLPFRTARRLIAWIARPRPAGVRVADEARIRELLVGNDRATRVVPGARCLERAFTGHVMLARIGVVSAVRIGARLPHQGVLEAHAWLELPDGRVFSGGVSPGDYATLR